MRNLLLALLAAAPCAAQSLEEGLTVRERMLEQFKAEWRERAPQAAAPPRRAEPEVEFRWDLEGQAGEATLRMSRKTLERWSERHRLWAADSAVRPLQPRQADRYLGSFSVRDALAVGDVVFTAVRRDGRLAEVPGLGEIGDFVMEALRAVDALQNGSAFDLLGLETDQFFRDRLGAAQGGGFAAPERHDFRVRLRVRGLERAGITFSDRVGRGPLTGWRMDGGADARVSDGEELRAVVTFTRPWPMRHRSDLR